MSKRILWFCTMMFMLFGLLSCDTDMSSASGRNSYEQKKRDIGDIERSNPRSFLSAQGTYRKNLIGEWVLEGTVISSTTVITYKDPILVIQFLSKTNTILGTEHSTIYEFIHPNSSDAKFKLKYDGFKQADNVRIGIKSAIAVN